MQSLDYPPYQGNAQAAQIFGVKKYMVQLEGAPSPSYSPGLEEGSLLRACRERWCLTSGLLQENSCATGWCMPCDLLLSYLSLPVPHFPETWDPE